VILKLGLNRNIIHASAPKGTAHIVHGFCSFTPEPKRSPEMNGPTNEPKAADGKEATNEKTPWSIPSISLPKGGGAIRGIGEKFGANPVTGTASMTVPIYTSPGRSGFGPQLALSYDSGAGNGPFGYGWNRSGHHAQDRQGLSRNT
jgi:Salmonella virulence plasmid 65kDa B protein